MNRHKCNKTADTYNWQGDQRRDVPCHTFGASGATIAAVCDGHGSWALVTMDYENAINKAHEQSE
jgi:serine/threonine protein phosphatase PrpC